MEIKRDIYKNMLIDRMHNGFIKVITGIRRSGKSYLLNKIFYNHLISEDVAEDHIIRFAFDSGDDLLRIGESLIEIDRDDRKVDPEKFMRYISSQVIDEGMYYLLLDEIQRLGSFETVLNGYLRKDNMDVYVTGSNSKFLSSDIITEFEGRGDEVHVLPLAFSEFFRAHGGSEEEALDDYMVYGGLPAIISMKTERQKSSYLITQLQNVYLKDIIKRYRLHSDQDIGELLDVIASGISSLTSHVKLANTFGTVKNTKISGTTVARYISHMEDAFMLSRVKRYDLKGKKYIGSPYKIYFEDVGLRNARLNFRQIEPTHIMENIIYNELRYRGFEVDVGVIESRSRDKTGREIRKQLEIDFVANMGSRRYYVQSAYDIPNDDKWQQEIRPYDKVGDSFKKIVIVGRSLKPRRNEKGYVTMGIKEFLLNPDSLEL